MDPSGRHVNPLIRIWLGSAELTLGRHAAARQAFEQARALTAQTLAIDQACVLRAAARHMGQDQPANGGNGSTAGFSRFR